MVKTCGVCRTRPHDLQAGVELWEGPPNRRTHHVVLTTIRVGNYLSFIYCIFWHGGRAGLSPAHGCVNNTYDRRLIVWEFNFFQWLKPRRTLVICPFDLGLSPFMCGGAVTWPCAQRLAVRGLGSLTILQLCACCVCVPNARFKNEKTCRG
jgi:hypothetical protein